MGIFLGFPQPRFLCMRSHPEWDRRGSPNGPTRASSGALCVSTIHRFYLEKPLAVLCSPTLNQSQPYLYFQRQNTTGTPTRSPTHSALHLRTRPSAGGGLSPLVVPCRPYTPEPMTWLGHDTKLCGFGTDRRTQQIETRSVELIHPTVINDLSDSSASPTRRLCGGTATSGVFELV